MTEHEIIDPTALGPLLKEIRLAAGLKQSAVAAVTDRSPKFVGDLEGGKPTAPFDMVLAHVKALGGRLVVAFPPPPDTSQTEVWEA